MKHIAQFVIVVLLLTSASCSMRVDLLFIGDSLVEQGNWTSSMQPLRVKNLAVGGFRTTDLLSQDMMAQVAQSHADQIAVMVGINDLMNGVSPDSLKNNYTELFDRLGNICSSIIIHAVIYQGHNRIQDEIRIVNQFLRSYAEEHGQLFVDLNPLLTKDEVLKSEFTTDGTHLTAAAYRIWEEKLRSL